MRLTGKEEVRKLGMEKEGMQQEGDLLKVEMAGCHASHTAAIAEWVSASISRFPDII